MRLSLVLALPWALVSLSHAYPTVYGHLSSEASVPVPKDFTSFSIELSYLIDYIGNTTSPNEFTRTLLENLQDLTGSWPGIRVGGGTEDRTSYNSSQKFDVIDTFTTPNSDQPTSVEIGPSFFNASQVLPDSFTYGFNFALNTSTAESQLQETADRVCRSIQTLSHLELGNENDLGPGRYRPLNYSVADYVDEWLSKSAIVASVVKSSCPDSRNPGFIWPSFAWDDYADQSYYPEEAINLALSRTSLITEISMHNYMNSAESRRLATKKESLQGLLMNHTAVVGSIGAHLQLKDNISHYGLPYILGESNSISGQGVDGITDVFGSALWVVDYSLWAAANGIARIHFHQGLNYRYAAWQPISSKGSPPTTRPPYYGHIMATRMVGKASKTQILNIPLQGDTESAYAAYDDGRLSRLAVLNLAASPASSGNRTSKNYVFNVPYSCWYGRVERLIAPGSDSTSNVTFGGVSYDYSLNGGKPVLLPGHFSEVASLAKGQLSIDVPASSAVVIDLIGCRG